MDKLIKIEFWPDYCSTGIWTTYEGMKGHVSEHPDTLPFTLSAGLLRRIEVMQAAFDHFADSGYMQNQYDGVEYSRSCNFFGVIEYMISKEFCQEHPEHAHLVDLETIRTRLINHQNEIPTTRAGIITDR